MEVIPVPLTDQPSPIPNLRSRTFFIDRHHLDNDTLKNALDQLVRQHWRKLGARLVSSRKNKRLEYHLPHSFDDNYTLFGWSSNTKPQSIQDIQDLSGFFSPGQNITFMPSMDVIDKLFRPSDWPFDRKSEPPNAPLLYVHLTIFTDATVVALSCPHVVADQFGVSNIVKAWLGVVEGKTPPEMVGYRDDVLPKDATDADNSEKTVRTGRMRVRSKRENALVTAGIVFDLIKNRKEESQIIFLPTHLVESLRDRASKALVEKHTSIPNLTNGDILSAIFTKFSRMHETSEYSLALSQTVNLRGRVPALSAGKGDGFIHNGLHYATANFQVSSSTPLHDIALCNRVAINQAMEETDIQAGVTALRELARCGQVMLICEPSQKLYSVSNWCGAWQGIDFSHATKEPQETNKIVPELMVLGQSRLARSPLRYRVAIMCKTTEGFWCDFSAPPKAIALIKDHLARDPMLESFSRNVILFAIYISSEFDIFMDLNW
ncbi:hypothetical protein NM208_g7879 [Fusarium decemcellulare]|uniref:Uncharacterized protein n=1 Tax=Fusarium decemcellulare TaxID=57161 RepID=A0ACC1S7E0_9HYPO|nr:hypothetical protein NM208_g7879 [Fusarium decemcellulare]